MEEIIKVVVGAFGTNCYVLKENKSVLIIDPGKKGDRIMQHINDDEQVEGILLTHGHFDHIGAVDELASHYNCKVYINFKDKELISSKHNSMAGLSASINHELNPLDNGFIKIGNFDLEIIETPGHTEGSILIRYKNNSVTGDTLFKGTIGRTDLFMGNNSKMNQSIKLIKTLNPDYLVYPGPEDITSLKEEFLNNPFYK